MRGGGGVHGRDTTRNPLGQATGLCFMKWASVRFSDHPRFSQESRRRRRMLLGPKPPVIRFAWSHQRGAGRAVSPACDYTAQQIAMRAENRSESKQIDRRPAARRHRPAASFPCDN